MADDTLEPAYPTFSQMTKALKVVYDKGKAREFDAAFRQAIWIAPGYPLSLF
jgi:hypothetical protein